MLKSTFRVETFKYFSNIFDLLPNKRKKQFFVLLFGMVTVALLETLALGVISLFATAIASPDELMSTESMQRVLGYLSLQGKVSPEQIIAVLSVLVVVAATVKNISRGYVQYWVSRYSATVEGLIGDLILERFLAVDYEWHLRKNAHDLLVTIGWRGHFASFLNSVLSLVSDLILVSVMFTAILIVQPFMMLLIISVLGASSYFIYRIVRKSIDSASKRVGKLSRESALDAAKTVMGIKDVRIFGLEKHFLRDFSRKVYLLARANSKRVLVRQLPSWIMESVAFTILAAAVLVMLYILKIDRLALFGTLSLLAVTAWRALPAVNRILRGVADIRTTFPFLDRVLEVLNDIVSYMKRIMPEWQPILTDAEQPLVMQPDMETDTAEQESFSVFKHSVDFSKVSFIYGNSGRPVLHNISCTIEKGASIGVVGHSGAGKSTFVDVFLGLLRPSSGNILIDGVVPTDEQLSWWRQNLGYVPQFPYIYDCSLAENVAFGESLENVDESRVLKACRQASIDFIEELEDGIYTPIGERGLRLSGGQRQRVAIARALYRNPEVLVFDEATSSLDTKSEGEIKRTIDSFKGEQTLLIIAHRLTTVEDCDYLIWLEKGKLIEMGKPEEILPKYSTMT